MSDLQRTRDLESFRSWFAVPIQRLCGYEHAGAALLMIALPLFERYGRQKVGLKPTAPLSDAFYDLLMQTFPTITSQQAARDFWRSYRHGLLHEGTLFIFTRTGEAMASASMRRYGPPVEFDSEGHRWVNPFAIAGTIVGKIEQDFDVFASAGHAAPFMQTHAIASAIEATTVPQVHDVQLGTGATRP